MELLAGRLAGRRPAAFPRQGVTRLEKRMRLLLYGQRRPASFRRRPRQRQAALIVPALPVRSLDPSLEIDLFRGSYLGPLRQAVGDGKTGKSRHGLTVTSPAMRVAEWAGFSKCNSWAVEPCFTPQRGAGTGFCRPHRPAVAGAGWPRAPPANGTSATARGHVEILSGCRPSRPLSLYSLIRIRRYSICPRSASRPIGPVGGSLAVEHQRLAVAGAGGRVPLHDDFDFVPILGLVVLQLLVRTGHEVVAALKLRPAQEDAAVGVHPGPELQLEMEVVRQLADRSAIAPGLCPDSPRSVRLGPCSVRRSTRSCHRTAPAS